MGFVGRNRLLVGIGEMAATEVTDLVSRMLVEENLVVVDLGIDLLGMHREIDLLLRLQGIVAVDLGMDLVVGRKVVGFDRPLVEEEVDLVVDLQMGNGLVVAVGIVVLGYLLVHLEGFLVVRGSGVDTCLQGFDLARRQQL